MRAPLLRPVTSAAYSPQTQEKDEHFHRTWKEKIKFDMINCENDVNWVENLHEYQKIYNESPHRSLGFLTPFEVYIGRTSNRPRNKLFLAEKRDFEVPEENVDEANYDNPTELEELNNLAIERDVLRKKALNASNNAAGKMVKRALKRQPPSLYYKRDAILVRIPISKKSIKGKKNLLQSSCEGRIIDADHNLHKYNIKFNDPVTSENKKAWVVNKRRK